jgi:hypothetical protein
MNALERELIEKITRLDEDKQRKLLELVRILEETSPQKTYTARELIQLPAEERNRIMAEAFAAAQNEQFEIFEAYTEENLDD